MSTGYSQIECPMCGGQADSLWDNATRTEELWCPVCGHFVNGTLQQPCSPTNINTKNK